MAAQRDKAGRFLPGHNILSDGRPKIPDNVKEALRAASPKAVEVLIQLLDDKKSLIRLEAAKTILDRAYGKPVQMQDISMDMAGSVDLTGQIRRVLLEAENDGHGIEAAD
ncbi:MAG: hypothetical protein II877_04765 [Synergistaceae bacterium]|nr:hypothetical protein [Synergistaceae bacterium]